MRKPNPMAQANTLTATAYGWSNTTKIAAAGFFELLFRADEGKWVWGLGPKFQLQRRGTKPCLHESKFEMALIQ